MEHVKNPITKINHNWQETSLYDAFGKYICTFSLNEEEVTEDNQDEKEAEQAKVVDEIVTALNSHSSILRALESITLSMSAHPDCVEGSEFNDMVSIANKALAKAKGL